MEKPFKRKYLDEHFKPLYIELTFPKVINGKTFVTIYAEQEEVIELPVGDAEKVVLAHKEFMDKIYSLLGV